MSAEHASLYDVHLRHNKPLTYLGRCVGCGEPIYFDDALDVEFFAPGDDVGRAGKIHRDTEDDCRHALIERLGVEVA